MSPNPKTDATAPQNPSKTGTAEWAYDEIMRHIEPDLITTALPTHAKKYKDETQEERAARMEAYDKAFAIFDSVAASLDGDYQAEMQKVRKDAEVKVAKEEGSEVKKIEKEIDASKNDE